MFATAIYSVNMVLWTVINVFKIIQAFASIRCCNMGPTVGLIKRNINSGFRIVG